MIKSSDYLVRFLSSKKIEYVFGYIGGMVTHIVDSIYQNDDVEFIQVYHEQTAAIAAEGYARETGKTGVALVTSGPGVTNLMTGIANAYFDSIPVIYITGQVNTTEIKYDKPIRQQGFQEMDVVAMVSSVTKYAKLVDRVEDLPYELEKAFQIANTGRKGPVVLDIPMNIQRMEVDESVINSFSVDKTFSNFSDWDSIRELIQNSQRPIFLIGGGCNSESTKALLSGIIEKYNIPFVTSLMGKGLFDEKNPNYVGLIGSYGNRCANMTVPHSDLIIALGTRLDTRQTGAMIDGFLKDGKIIHVDIDNAELTNHRLENRMNVLCDVSCFLESVFNVPLEINSNNHWKDYISYLKDNYNQEKEIERFVENKAPYQFMKLLDKHATDDTIYTADIGQNQMWAAQTLSIKENQHFFTSGGHAPMGYSLAAAIGASFGGLHKRVFAICGDGGFHIATQSLMLISQYNLPILVFVFNNSSLGMITQFQELYFGNRLAGTVKSGGYLVPNIEQMASSYNLPYKKLSISSLEDSDAIEQTFLMRNGVVELQIDGLTKVSPKLEFNRPIDQPSPYLSDSEQFDVNLHCRIRGDEF